MNKRLKDMVLHAYKKVPLYMNMAEKKGLDIQDGNMEDVWGRIPLIKKNDILIHLDSCISVEHLSMYMSRDLLRTKTSGSTGKCLDIYWEVNDNKRSLMSLWVYRMKYYGIKPDERHCYFYSSRNVGSEELEYERFDNRLGFSKSGLNKEKMVRIIKMINGFKNTFIRFSYTKLSGNDRGRRVVTWAYVKNNGNYVYQTKTGLDYSEVYASLYSTAGNVNRNSGWYFK